ncbi:MAG: hypothetical protein Q8K82_01735 [Gemmatimonadaceae bacterium]|nr:hypothetical protein [Gemmatimonadaceae bacterium]
MACATQAACSTAAPNGKASDSSAVSAAAMVSTPHAPLSWRFDVPSVWDDRVRMVNDPEETDRLAAQGIHGARSFEYVPRDSSEVPQRLLGVWVYDSSAWDKVSAEPGPAQGDEIARGPGVVYIAGLPQSNPFAPGSVDAPEFDKRTITLDAVKRNFRVVP